MFKRFKPPLSDRHDKLVFVVAFIFGTVSILLFRTLGLSILAMFIAVGIIFAYTFYIQRSARSSISLDRAGDNAYYLGLLFTLISLAYSLWKANRITTETNSETIGIHLLPDFGIALATTIAGILARVWIQQFRNDPADVETQARQELGEAIQLLRHSLLKAVSDMNITSDAANIAMGEIMKRTGQTVDAANIAMGEITKRTRETVKETIEANVEMASHLKHELDELTKRLSEQVKLVTNNLQRLAGEVDATSDHIKEQTFDINIDSSTIQQKVENLTAELESMRQKVKSTKEGIQHFSVELSALAERCSSVIPQNVANQLRTVGNDMIKQQETLASQFGTLKNNISQLGQNLNGIDKQASKVTEDMKTTGQNLTSQLRNANNQLDNVQQETLSEFESLKKEIRRTSKNFKQPHLATSPNGAKINTGITNKTDLHKKKSNWSFGGIFRRR